MKSANVREEPVATRRQARFRSRAGALLLGLLSVGAFGCAADATGYQPDPNEVESTQEKIVNGEEATQKEIYATVSILAEAKDGSQYCTGTLLNEAHNHDGYHPFVLTAEHCLDGVYLPWFARPKVWVKDHTLTRFIDPKSNQSKQINSQTPCSTKDNCAGSPETIGQTHSTEDSKVIQLYTFKKHPSLDVAVLHLDSSSHQMGAYVATKWANTNGWQNHSKTISGYGREEQDKPARGVLKIGTGRTTPDAPVNDPEVVNIGSPAYACSGDSGGPAYSITKEHHLWVAGVDSGQPFDRKPPKGKDPCAVKDAYTWVPYVSDWIAKQISGLAKP